MIAARETSGRVAKCIFDQIEANLAEIQPKDHQNVQKTHLLQKAPGVNGLNMMSLRCSSSDVAGKLSLYSFMRLLLFVGIRYFTCFLLVV